MMLENGCFICFGTNIGFLYGNIKPDGMGAGSIALIGADCIFFGVISAFFVGFILRKTKKNLLILRICIFSTSFFQIC